ncbi:MAG: cupin domain-containing protein [Alphaproteobacteria bacterium]|nr:cupin domain-containing protein [Alphaproteobacteria bacterium]
MAAKPVAIVAAEAAPNPKPSGYPEPFYSRMLGRQKRPLGDVFGLKNFGVNLTRLAPGAISALRHAHSAQDEFIYIVEGEPVLVTGAGERPLRPGMCAGFKAGSGDAHHLINRTQREVIYLEIGDRSMPDDVEYPDDDIRATTDAAGKRIFLRKNGAPFG